MVKFDLVAGLLDANEVLAQNNRGLFEKNKVYVINLMGVPGSGKTTVLEKVIEELKEKITIGVVEGDLYTTKDVERIERLGIPAVQINTEGACHLDAATVKKACSDLPLKDIELLVIENIGNLVCPAEFDLGENAKVMVISVTEGNDKPWKYPLMFRQAKAIIVNKLDLINYTDFDLEKFREDMGCINPGTQIIPVSATSGLGLCELAHWLYSEVKGRDE
ncbi:hydrogenase nickel incorporation protein HypB [Sporomusaceae bacterium BoRhaA]|uniref:hydrogenase nickel incorporation protein HypB n=1 Tax=Pelorhabdus rhamnosifermentans TaxID=2772457 RepID=UPI001C061854|nr:hydrogenase nickel incorporation protein HypB [Pelorhabdus rhamnosifermentans]MBU2701244.1 hydrogenase nickel incorporation protein HypB [Pelorhabdus rhamnosifermentans]